MPKEKGIKKTVLAQARSWATKNKLFGTQAFMRYVMLRFAENLNQVSDDFIFKGGNLLWVYIATPRATIDLDLATLKTNSHAQVRKLLEEAFVLSSEIRYSLLSFKEIEQEGKSGAAITIGYETDQGSKNRFDVDIVYALGTDSQEISSPVHADIKIRSATLENIIADKLSASHRFKSGNTRMKDYDDLWRLAQSDNKINGAKLAKLIKSRAARGELDTAWINSELEESWERHSEKYGDLPKKLGDLFAEVNGWLKGLLP